MHACIASSPQQIFMIKTGVEGLWMLSMSTFLLVDLVEELQTNHDIPILLNQIMRYIHSYMCSYSSMLDIKLTINISRLKDITDLAIYRDILKASDIMIFKYK